MIVMTMLLLSRGRAAILPSRMSERIAFRHVTRLGTQIYIHPVALYKQSRSCFSNIGSFSRKDTHKGGFQRPRKRQSSLAAQGFTVYSCLLSEASFFFRQPSESEISETMSSSLMYLRNINCQKCYPPSLVVTGKRLITHLWLCFRNSGT